VGAELLVSLISAGAAIASALVAAFLGARERTPIAAASRD
jgi:hypothetical protein